MACLLAFQEALGPQDEEGIPCLHELVFCGDLMKQTP